MGEELARSAGEARRPAVPSASSVPPAMWRPIDAADDMALVARALVVVQAVIAKEAIRTNEDADAIDPRVELLTAVISEYLRPERRDLWLTILNKHVTRAANRETDYTWGSLTALHQSCARKHATEAVRSTVPVVMFSRCRGGARNEPALWQLWTLDASRRTPFSLPEHPYVLAQAVLDDSLVYPFGPPPSPSLPPTRTTVADESAPPTVSAPCQTAMGEEPPSSTGDCAAKEDGHHHRKPYLSADIEPPDVPPRVVVVGRPAPPSRDVFGYAVIGWAAVGGLAVSISLLVMASVVGASFTDVVTALRDLLNFAWRGVRF